MLPIKVKLMRVKGKGRGQKIGIPTINFVIPHALKLPFGVYAGRIYFKDNILPVAIHYGPRPVFDEKDISLEAIILGKYIPPPQTIDCEFIKFIRIIKNFTSPQEMVLKIKKDIQEISGVLEKEEFHS